MNYITEINLFNNWQMLNPLPTSAINLWYALMHVNNRAGWVKEFTVANTVLEGLTRMSRATLDRSRNTLIQYKLISYKKGTKNQAGTYKMLRPYVINETPNDTSYETQCETPNETPYETPNGQEVRTLINKDERRKQKHKEKDKKEKFSFKNSIAEYTDNKDLVKTLLEFEVMRNTKKKPISTQTAATRLFNKLDELSNGDDLIKTKMLENSIFYTWTDVYELKDNAKQVSNSGGEFNIGQSV